MLPIVDKPLIQYAVEEAAAGITDMIFVTGRNKGHRRPLRHEPGARALAGRQAGIAGDRLRRAASRCRCTYIRQASRLAWLWCSAPNPLSAMNCLQSCWLTT
jgi:UTP--glucose-1-phosphate uridylyltransferase